MQVTPVDIDKNTVHKRLEAKDRKPEEGEI
jgi:hypothetical protein